MTSLSLTSPIYHIRLPGIPADFFSVNGRNPNLVAEDKASGRQPNFATETKLNGRNPNLLNVPNLLKEPLMKTIVVKTPKMNS